MNTIKAVIFDLDDVCYPEYEYALGGYKAVARYMFAIYGTKIYEDLAKQHNSRDIEELLTDVLAGHFKDIDANFLSKLADVYWLHQPQINLHRDMQECIAFLKKIKIKTALVTEGRPEVQRSKANALNLGEQLDTIIYASDLLGGNKMSEACMLAELLLDVPLSNTIYIGNGKTSDLQAVSNLGMTSIRLDRPAPRQQQQGLHGRQTISAIENQPADMTIHSLNEIIEMVKKQQSLIRQQ